MNTYAWVLVAAMAVAAVASWVAVARRRRATEQLAKPAFLVLLIAFAWLLHADEVLAGRWLLAALAFSLVGDVLLLGRSDRAFGFGLLAFLLAHVAFIGALATMPHLAPIWAGTAAVALVVILLSWLLLRPLARRDLREATGPVAYAVVIGLLGALAWWSGNLLVAVGASLFMVSDAVLAAGRFWREVPGGGVLVIVTFHVAQLLITLGVLRPDLISAR